LPESPNAQRWLAVAFKQMPAEKMGVLSLQYRFGAQWPSPPAILSVGAAANRPLKEYSPALPTIKNSKSFESLKPQLLYTSIFIVSIFVLEANEF
jgi:hypothetical protein